MTTMLSKAFILLATFLSFSLIGISQYTDTDVRVYLNNSSPHLSDEEMINKLISFELTDKVKKNVPTSTAMTLRRYKLAEYMLINGYDREGLKLSGMYSKPFACGTTKSSLQPSKQVYSDDDILQHTKIFMDLGIEPDSYLIIYLKKDVQKNSKIIDYVYPKLTEEEKATLEQNDFHYLFNDVNVDIATLQKVLDTSRAVMKHEYLIRACSRSVQLVEFCLKNGADINGKEFSETPIFYAVQQPDIEIVKYVLSKGGNICDISSRNVTNLEIAKRALKNSKYHKRSPEEMRKQKEVIAYVKTISATCPK